MNAHIKSLIDFDSRHDMYSMATRFVDYELVQGDIVEFGVYTGRSLALLSYYHETFKQTIHGNVVPRRLVVGLNSFSGLPQNTHERWPEGLFRVNHSYHPTIAKGEVVTPERVRDFFAACDLPRPLIISDYFKNIAREVNTATDKVALIHIDCDLYESTLEALNLVRPKIQDGSVILFDDWFNFRASRDEGEQKAFLEFLELNPQFEAIPYQLYATFGKSFIFKRRA